jgi:hypothetical protein
VIQEATRYKIDRLEFVVVATAALIILICVLDKWRKRNDR